MHTALSRRVVAGIAWASVRVARDNDALRNLGRWVRSNRVSCGRCRACRALVEGYDTRARPFTRSEGRLSAGTKETYRARDGWFRTLWKFLAWSASYEAGSAYRIQPYIRSNIRAVDRSLALKIRYSVSDGPRGHCARVSVPRVGHISRQFHRTSSRSPKHATDTRLP